MRRQAGFTLYEVLVALVLLGLLAGISAGVARGVRRSDRAADGYAIDLAHVRGASDLLAASARAAATVAVADGAVILDGVRWSAHEGALYRDDELMIRGISRLEVAAGGQGLVRLGVAPVPRREGARAPSLTRTVRLRVEERR